MKLTMAKMMAASGALLILVLGACAGQSTPGTDSLSGVVITGATTPAEVRLRDSAVPAHDWSATVDDSGAFTFDVRASLRPTF